MGSTDGPAAEPATAAPAPPKVMKAQRNPSGSRMQSAPIARVGGVSRLSGLVGVTFGGAMLGGGVPAAATDSGVGVSLGEGLGLGDGVAVGVAVGTAVGPAVGGAAVGMGVGGGGGGGGGSIV